LTEDRKDTVSQQTLRMMRSSINNSSQYTDDELIYTGLIIGSLYATMQEVPTFLPIKEQVSFFTNLISCFVVSDMINCGMINPHAAPDFMLESIKRAEEYSNENAMQQAEPSTTNNKAVN
jgi:hypothetical protein